MERYNPLAECVKRVIEGGLLGDLLHGLFVNEAADEGLAPSHWFWNRDTSGGIFIEHGVHFFDLAAYWLGEGHVVSAARSLREPSAVDGAVEEEVMCTCRYPRPRAAAGGVAACTRHTGLLFHFEHGFHQASPMDRQEMRLIFERGELRLFDWVPTHGLVRALLDEAATEALAGLLPTPPSIVLNRMKARRGRPAVGSSRSSHPASWKSGSPPASTSSAYTPRSFAISPPISWRGSAIPPTHVGSPRPTAWHRS